MPGVQELLVIGVVALLVVGPERLPGLARDAGRLMARIRHECARATTELREAAGIDAIDDELRALAHDGLDPRAPNAVGRRDGLEPTQTSLDRDQPRQGGDHAHTARWR